MVEADGRNPAAVPADMASRSSDVVRIATGWNDGYLGATRQEATRERC